jgi:hypothetical protein
MDGKIKKKKKSCNIGLINIKQEHHELKIFFYKYKKPRENIIVSRKILVEENLFSDDRMSNR